MNNWINDLADGARSPDDRILGSYLHGMFDTPQVCSALLRWAGLDSAEVIDSDWLR
ncbi:hypothetical protein [Massilia glaciei]|uniref:hypothetical protein n=1 Tax=Massilia glaciei TaxID=1524097 RepID=UPI00351D4EA0